MRTGKLQKVDDGQWFIFSGKEKIEIDPQHNLWLKIWGFNNSEVIYRTEGEFAVIQKMMVCQPENSSDITIEG